MAELAVSEGLTVKSKKRVVIVINQFVKLNYYRGAGINR
jgi:hypothetical protein